MNLAILCPGQGSQDAATLVALAREPQARGIADAFERMSGVRVDRLAALDPGDLQRNALAQPLVCATTLAAFAVLKDRTPPARIFAGYSVGELAAYGCAGWLSAQETIRLAAERAAAMDAATSRPAAMAAIRGIGRKALEALLAGREVYIAIVNGADRFVVAGVSADLAAVAGHAEVRGARVTRLGVRVASHTPLMRPAVARLRAALDASGLHPAAPVLAGVDGTPVLSRERAVRTLSEQIAEPILWSSVVEGLSEAGASVAVELPPGVDLSRLVRETSPAIAARAVGEFRTLEGLEGWIAARPS